MSHELLHPESINGAGKTVLFCTLLKTGVTYTLHATCGEAGVKRNEGVKSGEVASDPDDGKSSQVGVNETEGVKRGELAAILMMEKLKVFTIAQFCEWLDCSMSG